MSELITIQGHLFIITIICGMGIGVFYDILRILRRVVAHSNWMINVEDAFFWLISSVFLFVILFNQNNGIIRGYVILGVVLGMITYFLLISYFFVKIISDSINSVLSAIWKIIKFMLKPFIKTIKLLLKPIKWVYRLIRKWVRSNGKRLKKWMKTVKMLTKKI